MDLLLPVCSLLVAIATLVECQDARMHQQPAAQAHQPDQHRGGPAPPSFHDKKHVQDPHHVKEHYDGVIDAKDDYTEDELSFHYFKVHDYDSNNMLDGIELISALTHYHGVKGSDSPDEPRMPDMELSNMIDLILEDDDTNRDGYIDYPEFIMSQKR